MNLIFKRSLLVLSLLVLATALSTSSLRAQGGGGGPFGNLGGDATSKALQKIVGTNLSFTAKAIMKMSKASDANLLTLPLSVATLNDKSRMETDLAQANGSQSTMLAQLSSMGMDKTIMISRLDKQMALMAFPSLNSYTEVQTPREAAAKATKVDKTVVGKETIDGHPCKKTKYVITEEGKSPLTLHVWHAGDMKEFPIQTETTQGETTVNLRYTDVKFVKPDAKLFEAPAGLKKVTQEELGAIMIGKAQGGIGAQ